MSNNKALHVAILIIVYCEIYYKMCIESLDYLIYKYNSKDKVGIQIFEIVISHLST